MASDNVSAFNLYFLDVFDFVKTPDMSSDEAYNIIEEEWKSLSKDIIFYYLSKEKELKINKLKENCIRDNSIYSQENIKNIHELHRLMYLKNMNNNEYFSRVEFAKSA